MKAMKRRIEHATRSVAIALSLLAGADALHAQAPRGTAPETPLLVYDFNLGMEPADNVDHVKSLGFQGIVTKLKDPPDLLKLDAYVAHIETMDDFQLIPYVSYSFNNPAAPDIWRAALPVLAGIGAPLWVVVKQSPSDAAVRDLLGLMAREAEAHGIRAVIYPHYDTDIETALEASILIHEVGHHNLRNSLHTCHEIRGGHKDRLAGVVTEHVDETALVAIAGADHDAYVGPSNPFIGWDDVIKPLDEGDVSLYPFLQALHEAGYQGPVVLQTFGINNNPGHLQRSIRKYAAYTEQLAPGGR